MTAIGIGISIFTGSRKTIPGVASIPVNVDLPLITGEARVGVQLITTPGEWDGSPTPTFAYQWKAAGVNVGTNINTYTPVVGDVAKVITCTVTATNTAGSTPATSLGTLPVLAAVQTIAQILLKQEPNGIAIGFQDNSLLIRDTVTLANDFEGAIFPKLTFTRSTTAYTTNAAGLLVSTAINTPRFDYDPITHAPLGILIEGDKTNLILRSQDLSDAAWTKDGNYVLTANAATAPDGTLTADRYEAGINLVQTSVGVVPANTYTFSFYAKNNGGTAPYYKVFDVSNAAIIVDATSYLSQINGSTWSRISVRFGTPVGCAYVNVYLNSDFSETQDLFIWGAQLEIGVFASSYIPTTTVAVTRAADVCSLPVTAINYSQTVGTMVVKADPALVNNDAVRYEASFSAATNANVIGQSLYDSPRLTVENGGVNQQFLPAGGAYSGQTAAAWQASNFAISEEGAAIVSSLAGTVPGTIIRLNIGTNGDIISPLTGSLAKFMHLPRRASDAELPGLSTSFVTNLNGVWS